MSNLKSKIDKLDVEKLGTTSGDLSNLSNAVKNNVKKTEYNELVKKVSNISTTVTNNVVIKTGYNTEINEIK